MNYHEVDEDIVADWGPNFFAWIAAQSNDKLVDISIKICAITRNNVIKNMKPDKYESDFDNTIGDIAVIYEKLLGTKKAILNDEYDGISPEPESVTTQDKEQ